MVSFVYYLSIFYTLMVCSMLAAGMLLVSFQRERKNLLLRSCCFLLLLLYTLIATGHIRHSGHADIKDAFCESQAIILNYVFVSLHAHVCLMMLNNCYVALGWRWSLFEKWIDREWALVLLAYLLPMISLFSILYLFFNSPTSVLIYPRAFFCTIGQPIFWTLTIWFVIFSIVGLSLGSLLLYKTYKARQRVLVFGTDTQITVGYLFRLTLSLAIYSCLAFGSILPILLYPNIMNVPPLPMALMPPADLRSPWLNHLLCSSRAGSRNEGLAYYQKLMCPTGLSFFPPLLGIALFIMYGLGTSAIEAYRNLMQVCFGPTIKRRLSAMPLVEERPDASAEMTHYSSSRLSIPS